ncbi:MAG: hypothetical protein M1829_006046 [Trizodia sp. TS-e1964]|nr:MAG: hypothetical protein M1829_006046 [Trizodia sp. TS-e1964]
MSDSYERERQNNSRLDELASKVSALRGVTVDIYDSARSQDVIDNTVERPFPFPLFRYSLFLTRPRGSAERCLLFHGDQLAEQRGAAGAHGERGE